MSIYFFINAIILKSSSVYRTFLGYSPLELKEGKAHVRRVPVVDYDALHITVPLTA